MALIRHERLERARETFRVGVIADTHSHPHAAAVRLMREQAPDCILHAGDIGSLDCLHPFEDIAELHVVRGNIDTRATHLPDHLTLDFVLGAEGGTTARILLTHIAVRGPRLQWPALKLARDEDADLVVCGHSHMPLVSSDDGVAIFNPGSIGPRRFRLPITFGVIELSEERVRFSHIDCETGRPFDPREHLPAI